MSELHVSGIPSGIRIGTVDFHLPAYLHGDDMSVVARKHVVRYFRDVIYAECHTRKGYRADMIRPVSVRNQADALYCRLLDHANKNTGWFDDNWIVRDIGLSGATAVHTGNGVQVSFAESDTRDGQISCPGSRVALRRSKALPFASPGYYVIVSDHGMPVSVDRRITRLYLNISPSGACKLVAALTAYGRESGFRYQLKVLNNPQAYGRTDAAVLYLSSADLDSRAEYLRSIFHTVEFDFSGEISEFCTSFARGVGHAVEELTQDSRRTSYGLVKSLQLAEAVAEQHWSTICTPMEISSVCGMEAWNGACNQ